MAAATVTATEFSDVAATPTITTSKVELFHWDVVQIDALFTCVLEDFWIKMFC